MAVVKVFDQLKKEVGEMTLAPEVFEVEVRPEILHFVVRARAAADRAGTHSVKGRSQVSGGGHKPWKQKGTGRARAGSSRSPLWRSGAVLFGPTPRSYAFKVNKKVRQLAMKMALSARLADESLMVVRAIDLPVAKTKKFCEVATQLGLKKVLIVLEKENNPLSLAARNVPGVTVTTQDRLSVRDVLLHPQLVLLEGAAALMQKKLLGEVETAEA